MWNPTDSLLMTVEQKQPWEAWILAKTTPRRIVLESWICLLAAEGKASHTIAHRADMSRPTALLLRKRFAAAGPSGLPEDARTVPAAQRLSPKKIKSIVEATLQTPSPTLITRKVFTPVKDLAEKLMRYNRHYNKAPKTVKWEYCDPVSRIDAQSIVQATS